MGSGARVDLLWVYLVNPDRWFGPRELERLTGRALRDIQRNNEILAGVALIESATPLAIETATKRLRGTGVSTKRYRLNQSHPWVPAIRMLLESSIGSLHILCEELKKMGGIDVAFVFGSYATSEQTPESDIDLMVIGRHTLKSISGPIGKLEKRTNREINVVTYSPEFWAQSFGNRNHFVTSLMESPKVFLIGDQTRLDKITEGQRDEIQTNIA
jgi:predicted nucleotidyltransferase